ncbi:MAG TPA: substrate-binding domain-containing protein [Synergistaceae bacterium]|nr:substrate-binding domain-containing protein [Synergistaceae bacterium]HQH78037.1 substrate-binding domain-containing protein [Synergistaceae bacterium]HQK24323.1 substrate-binding domain-containing protein [Synergistaceae bacterium]
MKRTMRILSLVTLVLMLATAAFAAPVLRMATTTSTEDTGLLDYMEPFFRQATGIELQWVAVGTGKALELGKNCDVDVLLVHAPSAEKIYVQEGHGVNRRQVMYNDFVLLGPAADPAKVKGLAVGEALKAIAAAKQPFVSRGDKSGTHVAELVLWKGAGMEAPDKDAWYISTGQGMIQTINVAGEKNGYTLADRGTFIKYEANAKGNPPVVILVEGDSALRNQYSVIAVNPAKCANVQYDLALKYADWMVSPETQKLIADFKLEGKQLFFPNADE